MTAPRLVTYQGQTKGIGAHARDAGLSSKTVIARLRTGWSLERALSTPPDVRMLGRGLRSLALRGPTVAEVNAEAEAKARRAEVHARAKAAGLRPLLVEVRVAKGWTLDRALSTPAECA